MNSNCTVWRASESEVLTRREPSSDIWSLFIFSVSACCVPNTSSFVVNVFDNLVIPIQGWRPGAGAGGEEAVAKIEFRRQREKTRFQETVAVFA